MNPFVLWAPGLALIAIGVGLLVTGAIGMLGGVAVIVVGSAIESVGVLMWVRQRRNAAERSR